MPNPLSSRGFSDNDYRAAIGTLMGEAIRRDGLEGFAAIADVLANRLDAGVYGKSIASLSMNPGQFSTWSPKEENAYRNAKTGFAAALNPSLAQNLNPSLKESFSLAQKALDGVFNTGQLRGIAQGATAYHNAPVTAKNKTGGWHEMLQDKYGAVQIGAHTFTGPGLRPDQAFDPVTYNGMLAAPPAADPFLGDVGVPINRVDISSIPDLTPQQPATPAGFSLEDFSPVDAAPVDFSQFGAAPDFSDITANTAFDPLTSIAPTAPAAPNFNDVDVGSYPDITAGVFDGPVTDYSTPVEAATPSGLEAFGPSMSEMGQTGFSAGFNDVPGTPDFNAPSLEQRNADQLAQDRINAFESGLVPGFRQNDIGMLNDSLMAELAPTSPSMTPAPVSTTTAPAPAPASPMPDMGDISLPEISVTAPAPRTTAPSLPSFDLPKAPSIQAPSALPDFAPMPPARPQEQSFLGNLFSGTPSLPDFSLPSFESLTTGWSTPGLAVGALGLAAGGPLGAIAGYQAGKFGESIFDGIGDFFSGQPSWDNWDAATMGYGPGFNSRGERSHTGEDRSGGATRGDGSYSEMSGYNDNSPQGIL